MGYYAAGGYYSAGGFSFKKLGRALGKAASFVQSQPILSGVIGLIPGGSSALSGATLVAGMAHNSSAGSAVAQSNPGNPGMNAYASSIPRTRARRGSKPRKHGKYGYW